MGSSRSGKRRGPLPIAQVLTELTARRGLGRVRALEQFQQSWEQLVGPALASQTRLAALSRGVLEVVVAGSVVLQELAFRKHELLQGMRARDPGHAIRDIRFRIGSLD